MSIVLQNQRGKGGIYPIESRIHVSRPDERPELVSVYSFPEDFSDDDTDCCNINMTEAVARQLVEDLTELLDAPPRGNVDKG